MAAFAVGRDASAAPILDQVKFFGEFRHPWLDLGNDRREMGSEFGISRHFSYPIELFLSREWPHCIIAQQRHDGGTSLAGNGQNV